MALEGTLRDFSLADIFQLIGLQRKTGVLTLRGKEDTVTVTFLDGKVVAADSLNKRLENRLGTVLVKSGFLTNEQLSKALEIQKETLQRLGFILVHHKIISQEDLRSALQLQILQIVYRLFRWKDGEYHFSQETTIEYDRDNVVPITAESILMEGARMIDEWPILEKRIRSYSTIYRHKAADRDIVVVSADEADEVDFDSTVARKKAAGSGDRIRISTHEKQIWDMVDGVRTVNEIVESSRMNEFDTVKALYELLTRDLIEEVRTAASRTEASVSVDEEPIDVEAASVSVPLLALLLLLAAGLLFVGILYNPANDLTPVGHALSTPGAMRKAISAQRIEAIGEAVSAYHLATGRLPDSLATLTPFYISPKLLQDPWGHKYNYLQRGDRFVVIGFSSLGHTDPDLFLSQSIDTPTTPADAAPRGGISLIE